jgi:two-component system sensor histidine kinase/response regulator
MLKSTSVLLVEDNKADALFVRTLLPAHKYKITHVTKLTDACEKLFTLELDIVLLDLSLPDTTGLDTFQILKEKGIGIPIVILTGLVDDETAVLAVKLGAQDYIQKSEVNALFLERSIQYAIERKVAIQNEKRLAVLEQREEFMATLTHDLKNPLIGTNRLLELLADEAMGVVTKEHAETLLQIRDSNKILLFMIQNLLDVYRFERDIDAVVLENAYLHDIVAACLKDINLIAQSKNISIKTNFSEIKQIVNADALAMRRVFQNLLDNALKFTPPGGEISLTVSPTNGSVCVEIEDNGPGMSPEEQTRIFHRFGQGRAGRRFSPGTGLGLFLCKQIVDAHKGEIKCLSKEGQGTKFLVTLPAA